jgi:hypothetical protein
VTFPAFMDAVVAVMIVPKGTGGDEAVANLVQ